MKITVIKQFSAIVLCASFFMPLAQCSGIEGTNNLAHTPVTYSAYSSYDWPSAGSFIAIILFFWPLLVQGIALLRATNGTRGKLFYAELTMCLLTALGISWLLLWGQSIRFGSFAAYSAIASYFVATLRSRKDRRPDFQLDTGASH